ncbi:urease accessory protein UreF [Synechococcus sp. RSCCF101]|uniref:urease accessory protein UreF n=1 Tax=Synechococcus sp. RSCCF101 TaxID=2511069 RepID=UPI001248FE84|nr:urease accessory UreF family protein [Synechococcus sp. RSCCF101]QEY32637.1 urease accessory protein UreF [Synechococcus sp. RSCCF101]
MSPALLRLMQLVSPALPVGAFSYSEGLESLVQQNRVIDAATVEGWLAAELERGCVRIEAASLPPFLSDWQSWSEGDAAAGERLRDRDGRLLAMREAAPVRAQQRQMGRSLLQVLEGLGCAAPGDWTAAASSGPGWTAAWAWAGTAWDIPAPDLVIGYLHSWCASQLSAAVRLVPLGPTEAQAVLQALDGRILEQASRSLQEDPGSLWTGGVGASISQLQHGELYSRLFRS